MKKEKQYYGFYKNFNVGDLIEFTLKKRQLGVIVSLKNIDYKVIPYCAARSLTEIKDVNSQIDVLVIFSLDSFEFFRISKIYVECDIWKISIIQKFDSTEPIF